MDYQSYEDYMRSVLGYSPYIGNNYTYTNEQEDMYNYSNSMEMPNLMATNEQSQNLNHLYPEIYKMVYPMVCKACNINANRELTKDLLEQMTDEIYINIEPEQEANNRKRAEIELKNGDVVNPNAKEPERTPKETRQTNFLLRDLIRILILREWGRPNRPPIRPQYPPQGGGRPPMRPPIRPRYF